MASAKFNRRSKLSRNEELRQLAKARKVLEKYRRRLLARKGVHGVGVAIADKESVGRVPVIEIHVLKRLNDVPSRQLLPKRLEGVHVDVVEVPSLSVYSGWPGARIAPKDDPQNAGTLGMVVFTIQSGAPRFLTNSHVIAKGFGDGIVHEIIDLRQPGSPVIGTCGPSQRFQSASRDWAIITPSDPDSIADNDIQIPYGIGKISSYSSLDDSDIGNTKVTKIGERTGRTTGLIKGLDYTVNIVVNGVTRAIGPLIGIVPSGNSPFMLGGDSGSPVIRDRNGAWDAVGICVANNAAGIGFAFDFTRAADKLKFRV